MRWCTRRADDSDCVVVEVEDEAAQDKDRRWPSTALRVTPLARDKGIGVRAAHTRPLQVRHFEKKNFCKIYGT